MPFPRPGGQQESYLTIRERRSSMSRLDRTLVLRIRWGVLFAPVCWLLTHPWVDVYGGTWADPSGVLCRRCGKFKVPK